MGLHGHRRQQDAGSVNGERFEVMAGAGFDASMIAGTHWSMKDRLAPALSPHSRQRRGAIALRRERRAGDHSGRLDRRLPYELDGARPARHDRFKPSSTRRAAGSASQRRKAAIAGLPDRHPVARADER